MMAVNSDMRSGRDTARTGTYIQLSPSPPSVYSADPEDEAVFLFLRDVLHKVHRMTLHFQPSCLHSRGNGSAGVPSGSSFAVWAPTGTTLHPPFSVSKTENSHTRRDREPGGGNS